MGSGGETNQVDEQDGNNLALFLRYGLGCSKGGGAFETELSPRGIFLTTLRANGHDIILWETSRATRPSGTGIRSAPTSNPLARAIERVVSCPSAVYGSSKPCSACTSSNTGTCTSADHGASSAGDRRQVVVVACESGLVRRDSSSSAAGTDEFSAGGGSYQERRRGGTTA